MSIRAISALTVLAVSVWFGLSPASAQTNTRVIETVASGNRLTQVANLTDTFKTQQAETPAAQPAGPEKRIALVIGNSAYQSVATLVNPANDGKAIAQFLTTAGFDVVQAVDLTRQQMADVFSSFATMITERGPNTVALVYYAGHGLQVDGENYLVPVDAKIEKEEDIAEQTVRLVDVMKVLELAKSRTNIVIIDACRNNPFEAIGDTVSKGLAIVDAPTGSIVAYSTAPGTEALDGSGRHSPYAAALMRVSKQPGLSIELLFKRVRLLVNEATDGKQIPWESSSLTSDFTFFAIGDTAGKILPTPVKVSRVAELSTRPVNDAYAIAIEEDSVEYYEEFVRLYPTHPLCDRIRTLLTRRLQAVAWHQAVKSNTSADYANFISRFGNSDFARIAKRLQVKPRQFPVQSNFVKINFGRNNNGGFNGNGGFNNGGLQKIGLPGNNNGLNNGGKIGIPGNNAGLPNNGGIKIAVPGNNGLPQNGNKVGIPANGNTGIAGGLQNGGKIGIPGNNAGLPNNGGIKIAVPGNNGLPQNGNKVGIPANGNTGIAGGLQNGGRIATLPNNAGVVNKAGIPVGNAQPQIRTAPVTTVPARVTTLPNNNAINQRVINPQVNTQINRVQIQQNPVVQRQVQVQQIQVQRQVQVQRNVQPRVQLNNIGGNNQFRRFR